jgi:hypothetical protein
LNIESQFPSIGIKETKEKESKKIKLLNLMKLGSFSKRFEFSINLL